MTKTRFEKRSFDLGSACVTFLVAFGVQLVFQMIVLLLKLPDAAKTWTVVIGNQIVLCGVCLYFCFYHKVDPMAITGLKRPPKWYLFPIYLLIAVFCITAFAPIAGVISKLLTLLGYEYQPSYAIPLDNPGLFALAFLGLTILPAIGEELAVRGVILSGGKQKSPLFAILFSALIFALMHGNLRQLSHQFLLGAVMGYLAYLSGGIYASAFVHFANNGIALLVEYGKHNGWIDYRVYWYLEGKLGVAPTLIGVSVSFFALAMLLLLVTCLTHFNRSKEEEYIPSEGKLSARITAYMTYLSVPKEEREAEKEKAPLTSYSVLMAVVLAVVLAAIVCLSLIPGVAE